MHSLKSVMYTAKDLNNYPTIYIEESELLTKISLLNNNELSMTENIVFITDIEKKSMSKVNYIVRKRKSQTFHIIDNNKIMELYSGPIKHKDLYSDKLNKSKNTQPKKYFTRKWYKIKK